MSGNENHSGAKTGEKETYESPEEYIERIPMWTRKKNSLADIRILLGALGVSEKNIIHVAGTNGKGSVCAYLTSILNASGFSTGTFVSPHLVDVKERFLIDQEPVREADLSFAFEKVITVVREKCEEGLAHPSYFEFCFLIAMTIFTEKDVDFRILETGLGGRLDATNSIKEPLACVITSISKDHTQYLGDTIEEIANEKAGIIKPHVPVIFDAGCEEAARVIIKSAKDAGAEAFPVREFPGYLNDLKFDAPYQKMNAALAVKTLEVAGLSGITPETVREGIMKARWPGRMEEITPGIWLDGAHNTGGISAFTGAVKEQQNACGHFGIRLLFAVADDKDYKSMICLLSKELQPMSVTVTAFEGERAAAPDELKKLFISEGCEDVKAVSDPKRALDTALSDLKADERLYITGSLYLIGALRPALSGGTLCE